MDIIGPPPAAPKKKRSEEPAPIQNAVVPLPEQTNISDLPPPGQAHDDSIPAELPAADPVQPDFPAQPD